MKNLLISGNRFYCSICSASNSNVNSSGNSRRRHLFLLLFLNRLKFKLLFVQVEFLFYWDFFEKGCEAEEVFVEVIQIGQRFYKQKGFIKRDFN
uniref:Uncharacterized protein n=1 Tax=Panagrolaimus sp. PS1159 TaxID=55785 RepID=A0AC35F3J2_9BILA